MERIYLDNAATTQTRKEAVEAMLPFFSEKYGNASSLHSFGQEAADALAESRQKIADCLKCDASEIFFTGGGTESDNLAIRGVAFANQKKGKHIVTTEFEHHAVLHTCEYLKKMGWEITLVKPDKEGLVSAAAVAAAVRKDTVLVSVMHANNEIGTIQPIGEIGKLCRERGVLFHSDAVQSFGKLDCGVGKLNVDLLSLSSHKIYGPKGVGALYVRKGTKIEPIMFGGGHERGLRSGTENVAGIAGFARAAELAEKERENEMARQTKLRDGIIGGVLQKIPDSWLNGSWEKRLANNANFGFGYVEGESLLIYLDLAGLACSTGSACSSKSLKPSHVLTSLGLKPEEAHGSLRISLGRNNTEKDVGKILEHLPKIVEKLRKMSALKPGMTFGSAQEHGHGHAEYDAAQE